jgi:hypothetical protein
VMRERMADRIGAAAFRGMKMACGVAGLVGRA